MWRKKYLNRSSGAPGAGSEATVAQKKTETPRELIHALIEALGADPEQTKALEINLTSGHVRALGKDRSLRSYKVAA